MVELFVVLIYGEVEVLVLLVVAVLVDVVAVVFVADLVVFVTLAVAFMLFVLLIFVLVVEVFLTEELEVSFCRCEWSCGNVSGCGSVVSPLGNLKSDEVSSDESEIASSIVDAGAVVMMLSAEDPCCCTVVCEPIDVAVSMCVSCCETAWTSVFSVWFSDPIVLYGGLPASTAAGANGAGKIMITGKSV